MAHGLNRGIALETKTLQEDIFRKRITLLKFILSVLVVCIHARNISEYAVLGETTLGKGIAFFENIFSANIGAFAVPGFFLISGFLLYRNWEGNCLKKLKSRFFSICIPYFVWNVLYFLFFFVVSKLPYIGEAINTKPEPITLSYILEVIFLHKMASHMWYMENLIIYVAVAPILYYILKHKIVGIIFLITLLVCAPYISIVTPGLGDGALFLFCIGGFLALHCEEIIIKGAIASFGVNVLLFACAFGMYYIPIENIYYSIVRTLLGGVALYGLICNIPEDKIKIFDFMKQTFFIYAMHIMVLDSIQKIIKILLPNIAIIALLNYLAAIVLTVVIILGVAAFLRRFLSPIYMLLCGGWKRRRKDENSSN